jgi:hypothetical protein
MFFIVLRRLKTELTLNQIFFMNEVYITGISKFLPNDPVSNDEMEEYIGMIDNKPSRARRIVSGITAL